MFQDLAGEIYSVKFIFTTTENKAVRMKIYVLFYPALKENGKQKFKFQRRGRTYLKKLH